MTLNDNHGYDGRHPTSTESCNHWPELTLAPPFQKRRLPSAKRLKAAAVSPSPTYPGATEAPAKLQTPAYRSRDNIQAIISARAETSARFVSSLRTSPDS